MTDATYTGPLESAPTDDPAEIPADVGDLYTEDAIDLGDEGEEI